ncbi:CRISPR-associated RAMP protein [Clostridium botulinum]|nr:CRISPR-associated RAMP protein [Clostridium botulinum]NFP54841.1 CRISPR-associated RAMP protein [Clostridium botulinum]NFT09787.1 CRISPR-associated RAMP protein [Clostridium botulinum]NFT60640.1 CRISPR-associated RAMP protein [Clostridium botulinum]
MLFNKFVNRRIVTGTIKNKVPIFIGKGSEGFDPTEVASPVLKDYNGNPIIPGSSLKGVLRSTVERILSNEVFKEKWHVCDILSKEKCCLPYNDTDKGINKLKKKFTDEEKLANKIYQECCDACKLFGGHHFGGKLQIKDMNFIGKKPKFGHRDGVGIDRDTGASRQRVKYNFEVVEAGSEFSFYMIADNLEEEQEKLFNLIIKLLEDGEISVGGKTSRGLGQIVLKDKEIQFIDKNNLADYYGLK